MLPNIIVVDKSGPYSGADIKATHIVVRQRQKDKVIRGLRMFMPNIDFKIMTKKEFIDAIDEKEKEKTGKTPDTD